MRQVFKRNGSDEIGFPPKCGQVTKDSRADSKHDQGNFYRGGEDRDFQGVGFF